MLNNQSKEYVDFNMIKEYVGITNEELFGKYLKEVYKDLADRSDANKKRGIIKLTFLDYLKLPFIISDKVFSALDKDHDGFLNPGEFIMGMANLYNGTFEQTIKIIFDVLDFNNDGVIEKDDVRMLLSYLPLKTDKTTIEYKYQMDSQEEIDEIIAMTFEKNAGLKLNEFVDVVENKKSDVFLQFLCFIYQKKPFTEENINILKDSKKKPLTHFGFGTPNTHFKGITSPSEGKYLPPPNKMSSLSPANSLCIGTPLLTTFELNPTYSGKTPELSGYSGMIRFHNEKIINNEVDDDNDNENNIKELIKKSKNVFTSPSTFFLSKKSSDKGLTNFMLNSPPMSMEEKGSSLQEENTQSNQNTNVIKEEEISYEQYIYKLSESTNSIKLKKYYLVLIGKDLFYYKTYTKEELAGMHNLSGCFVKEDSPKIFNQETYYSFQIDFPTRKRKFYCKTREICDKFIFHLKKSLGYLNVFDYYEMLDVIGEGIFGVVKLGVYKKTKERVAIKIIKKYISKPSEIELVRTEIDIMKICHHPNIVKLLDHFENGEYIFIVMEYIAGGDLAEYLKKNNYNITEKRASEIIYQIALALKYLHQFGIIHRDIKPENIMLTECSDKGKVKIMDFGLSKILGAKEKSIDGFGTLTFVAPEVLVRKPYNKEVDIWSMGVILYLMLSGKMPFDDDNDNEEKIAKKIVYSEIKFKESFIKKRSPLVVDLLKKCLTKAPEQRIKIDEIINNEWFKLFKINA